MPQFSSITDCLAHTVSFIFVFTLKGHTRSKNAVLETQNEARWVKVSNFSELGFKVGPSYLG